MAKGRTEFLDFQAWLRRLTRIHACRRAPNRSLKIPPSTS
jgi:hypothetical protein